MNDIKKKSDKVKVALEGRSYDIFIGDALIENAAQFIAPLLKRSRCWIITDHEVAAHHLETLSSNLTQNNIDVVHKILPAGEGTKSFAALGEVCDWLLDEKVERSDIIIALGGGVIGDLTGFAAAILKRGTRFVQIPTTLLAQVDSSVGGKTGINVSQGKNLIGAFHQPDLVLADRQALTSLPRRQILAGFAEIIKYGALGDAQFFEWLEENSNSVIDLQPHALAYAVKRSCEMKADIVARDERESGDRALLNLGHTFAHAFEALTGYGDKLLHGEAVGLGMAMAFNLSRDLNLCSAEAASRVSTLIDRVGLPAYIEAVGSFQADALIDVMAQDKKAEAGTLRFILARKIGETFISKDVTPSLLRSFLLTEGAQA
jgi:3-dehydroquinate synthase